MIGKKEGRHAIDLMVTQAFVGLGDGRRVTGMNGFGMEYLVWYGVNKVKCGWIVYKYGWNEEILL